MGQGIARPMRKRWGAVPIQALGRMGTGRIIYQRSAWKVRIRRLRARARTLCTQRALPQAVHCVRRSAASLRGSARRPQADNLTAAPETRRPPGDPRGMSTAHGRCPDTSPPRSPTGASRSGEIWPWTEPSSSSRTEPANWIQG